jgi:hypothetical protein
MLVMSASLTMPNGLRADLVAYYNFDDGQTVTDQVGSNHGTVLHNVGFSTDTPDGSPFSLDLTATGVGPGQDYVRIGPAALGGGEPEGRDFGISDTDSFTISAWVNYTQSERGIVTIKQDLTSVGDDRSGVTFGIDANENLFIGIITSTGDEIDDEFNTAPTFRDITTDDLVPTDEWVHIAATFDLESDTLVAYINGLASEFYNVNPADSIVDDGTEITGGMGIDWFDNDGSFTGFGASGNGPLHDDSAGDFTRLFYDGLLDEVAIWNEALSAEEIQNVMENGVVGGPPSLQAGDADQDLDFDQLDLVKVQVAAKYLTGLAATWGEGDWNGAPGGTQGDPPVGDGLFSQQDIIAALAAGKYLTGPYAALDSGGQASDAQTSVGYNVGTGEVWVDAPAGTELTSINIDSAGAIFTGNAAQNLGGSFDNDTDDNIFKATFGESFGSLSFGNVAQPGLSEDFLLNDLAVVGSLAGGGDLGNVDLIYVPEPNTALLCALAVLFGSFGRLAWKRRCD